jgi:hypothetical protein
MIYYAIRRVHPPGGWVTKAGFKESYTNDLRDAQLYKSRDRALDHCCGNETVEEINLSNHLNIK